MTIDKKDNERKTMILTTAKNITPEQLLPIQNLLTDRGAEVCQPIEWNDCKVIVLSGGSIQDTDISQLKQLGVRSTVCLSKQYKLVSREFKPTDTIVTVGNTQIGGKQIQVIAGPCSVESQAQMQAVAHAAKEAGCNLIRGGAYKPRSSPYAFQGHGELGLQLLTNAANPLDLPVVTELMDVRQLDHFMKYNVGAIQVGTRNMQNFDLLKELGRCRIPVILKRGMSATVSEWLLSAEYIASGGNTNIILCERGIRTFETAYRNVLDVTSVIVAKKETHLPVIIDPSHAGGKAWMVPALSQAALAVGADGLLIEMHPNPAESWCDADQAIDFAAMKSLMQSLDGIARAIGRTLL